MKIRKPYFLYISLLKKYKSYFVYIFAYKIVYTES